MNKKTDHIILAVILAVAAILRLLHPLQIPYTYDELSALARTHYHSFSELIKKGVIIDAHPAGVQVFLYYWVKLFGYNELVVKMPFIICGILSVWFIFRLGKEWFNPTVGLICAAYMATLEYTVMYSEEARPYSCGLFFTLAMVYYWSKVIFKPEEHFYRNVALYVLFAALCAYTHHFCLLIAGVTGITGLFFVRRQYLLKYVVAGIAIFVLYIPHLHIFFYQLSVGGIGGPNGWLGKPRNNFIVEYIKYIFHFSRSVSFVALLIILFGIYSAIRGGEVKKKYSIISLCWFAIPFLAGFFYSIYVNPVLQYSVLLFSFPFLLFCLFGWLPETSAKVKTCAVVVICAVNIFSLVHARNYYRLFYKMPYEQPVILTDSILKAMGNNQCTAIIQTDDSDRNVLNYYIRKHRVDTSFFLLDKLGCYITHKNDYRQLIHFLQQQKKPYLSFGCTSQVDPNIVPLLTDYYPYLVKKWNFYDADFYLLSNISQNGVPYPYLFESVNDFEQPVLHWQESNAKYVTDSVSFSGKHSYKVDSLNEWAPAFACGLWGMMKTDKDFIEVSLEVRPLEKLTDVYIVSVLKSGDKTLNWNSTPVQYFIPDTLRNKWVKVRHTVKLSDIDLAYPDIQVNIYIWNRGKKNFYMDNFDVKVRKGNPVIYGLLEKI